MTAPDNGRLHASMQLLERARRTAPGGVHSNVRLTGRPHPLFFERGTGAHLWDVDGNEYVDFVLGQGPAMLGHAHPRVIEAVQGALSRGQLFAGQHPGEVELSELVCELIPCAESVRLGTTGTEAAQGAIRIARAGTGRRRVIKFESHYHGWLDGLFASNTPSKLPQTPERHGVAESDGQIVPPESELTVLPYQDSEALERELEAGDVAAVILEPVAANNSVIVSSQDFLRRARAACDRTGAVLIFDEIISGFRLGLGGAQAMLGVTPDLAVFGKAMANGFPIGCIAGKAELLAPIGTGRVTHAGTFNANVSAVAAALATVKELRDDPSYYARAREVGERLMRGIADLDEEVVVQGVPELFWIGFGSGPVRTGRDLERFDVDRAAVLSGELVSRGIYTTARGTWYLSGVHEPEDADRALEALAASLEAVPA